MPRMDGLSLLLKLQENEKQVSTIIVSAYMSVKRVAISRRCPTRSMASVSLAS